MLLIVNYWLIYKELNQLNFGKLFISWLISIAITSLSFYVFIEFGVRFLMNFLNIPGDLGGLAFLLFMFFIGLAVSLLIMAILPKYVHYWFFKEKNVNIGKIFYLPVVILIISVFIAYFIAIMFY